MNHPLSMSRRGFVKGLSVGGTATAILCYEGSRALARSWSMALPKAERPLLLHHNENPLGPGRKVLQAMRAVLGDGASAGRYPFGGPGELAPIISAHHGVMANNVMIGNGSSQLLRSATHVFTSPSRPLVCAAPAFEECAAYARLIGHEVIEIPVGADLRLDLDAMADAAKDSGLLFIDNPNNPTGTLRSGDAVSACIDRVLTESSNTMILIDEAYHDYVTNPSHLTQIPTAVKNGRVLVSRTFSKAHGMAGMRIGYFIAQPGTLATIHSWHYGLSLNVPALAAAMVSTRDVRRIAREQMRNDEARLFTLDWFRAHGFESTDTQTNFVFVKTGIPAAQFRDGCFTHGIKVGRDFPPYANTWARISVGTLDEMKRATATFGKILRVRNAASVA